MKKILSVVIAVVTVVNVVFCLKAFAAESDIVYEGDSNNFVAADSEGGNLFGGIRTLYPGDEIAQDVGLRNDSDNTVAVYLRAQPVQSRYEPFLDLMTLSVYDGMGIRISRSDEAQTGGIKNETLIAKLPPGSKTNATVILHIDSRMGNEFQGTGEKIRWIFSARKMTSNESSVEPSAADSEATADTEPTEPVDSALTSQLMESVEVSEYSKPVRVPDMTSPKTGDSPTGVYIALTALTFSFIIALIIRKIYNKSE